MSKKKKIIQRSKNKEYSEVQKRDYLDVQKKREYSEVQMGESFEDKFEIISLLSQ